MEKTAVDFLFKEFSDILGAIVTKPTQDMLLFDAIKKAKEIEKQQIITAFHEGIENTWKYFDNEMNHSGEIYYKQTFGGSND